MIAITTKSSLARISGFVRVALINACVLAGLLLLIEIALRFYWPDYSFYLRTQPGEFADRALGGREWPRKDLDLGWVLGENAADFRTDEGRQHPPAYKANPQGFRDVKNFSAIDYESGKRRVMMLGDSFLFAVGLDAQDAIPSLLEQLQPRFEIYNLGIPGWGLDQMYLAYKKYVDLIRPEIVVICYIDENLQRTYEAFRKGEGMNKPSFAIEGNRLVARTEYHANSFLLRILLRKSIIANSLYVVHKENEVRKLAKAIFTELIREIHRRGASILIVRIPRLEDSLGNRRVKLWSLKDFFREQSVPYIELLDEMPRDPKLYIPNNMHLSAAGTAYVAALLSRQEFRP